MSNQQGSRNAFDFIRVCAAAVVLYSHSFGLYGFAEPRVAVVDEKFGSVAVWVFFVVSGFLVCQSWERDPAPFRFFVRRALRVMPGLLAAVLFTTFVVGALATSLPLQDYLTAQETWAYFLSNASLVVGIFTLPGVFEGSPSSAANGSLWTLRYEVAMYALLVAFGSTGRLKQWTVAAFVLCASGWATASAMNIDRLNIPLPGAWRFGLTFDALVIAKLGTFFFGACSLFLFRQRVPMSGTVAAAMLIGSWLLPAGWAASLFAAFVLYGTLVFAQKAPAPFTSIRGFDVSYGIYVYAFPIQQLVSRYCLANDAPWAMALVASATVVALIAALSWICIEKPALTLKSRLARPSSQPLMAAA